MHSLISKASRVLVSPLALLLVIAPSIMFSIMLIAHAREWTILALYIFLIIAISITRKWGFALYLFSITPVILTAVAFAPGIYTPDSWSQLMQAQGLLPLGDWHPPLMAMIWRLTLWLTGKPEAMFWMQLVLFSFGLICWAWFLIRREFGWLAVFLLTAAFLNPAILNFAGVIWKDVWLAFAFLLATPISMHWLLLPKLRHKNVLFHFYMILLSSLFVFLGLGFRQNAVLAALPLLAVAIYPLLPAERPSRAFVTAVALATVGTLALFGTSTAVSKYIFRPKETHPEQYMLLHDLTAIGRDTGIFLYPAGFRSSEYSDEKASAAYSTHSGGYLFLGESAPLVLLQAGDRNAIKWIEALKSTWWREVLSSPIPYLNHRFAVLFSLLRIGEGRSYLATVSFTEKPESGTVVPGAEQFEEALQRYFDWADTQTWLYYGWFWLLVLVATLAGAINARHSNLGKASITLSLSGLLYAAPYLFLAPASDFRYLYWCVISASLSSALLLFTYCDKLRTLNQRHTSRISPSQR